MLSTFIYQFHKMELKWWCPKIRIHQIPSAPDNSDMIRYVSNQKNIFSVTKSCFIILIKVVASIFIMWMQSIVFTYQGPRCINSVMSILDLLHYRNQTVHLQSLYFVFLLQAKLYRRKARSSSRSDRSLESEILCPSGISNCACKWKHAPVNRNRNQNNSW